MATTEPMVTFNTRVPLGLHRRLEAAAERTGVTKADIARRALEQYLNSLEELEYGQPDGTE